MSLLKACAGLNCAPAADQLDLRSKQLIFVPDFIYRQRRTLRELSLDYNQIKDLPPLLFQQMVNLRVLTLSENDLIKLPPQIANLDRLVELDISKNGLIDLPDNIQYCHSLRILDVSCNPFVRTPDCVGRIRTLTKCCLNDTNLERMPNEIGSLANLQVLEARENILTTLPSSLGSLSKLVQLDLGGNEIDYLPSEIGQLSLLQELWLDSNNLAELPPEISHLSRLECLDVSKNRLDALPENVNLLQNLVDLHLSENCIHYLPPGIGHLKKLTLLKMDMNRLASLPDSLEHLVEMREFVASENAIETAPAALFELPNLEVLYLDQNKLQGLPTSFGKNPSLRILSFRSNDLIEIPETVNLLTELKVLDLRNNKLRYLPAGMTELDLSALWVGESQVHPVMKLDRVTDNGVTTCQHHFLPQNKDMSRFGLPIPDPEFDRYLMESPNSPDEVGITFLEDGETPTGKEIRRIKTPRYPPHRNPLKDKAQLAVKAVDRRVKFESKVAEAHYVYDSAVGGKKKFSFFKRGRKGRKDGKGQLPHEGESRIALIEYREEITRPEAEIKSTPEAPSTPDLLRIPKFVEEDIIVDRVGREELGFSFWGDTDYAKEGIFVKTIAQGSACDRDGRLKPGDQILEVEGEPLENLSNQEVAKLLMNTRGAVKLRIHRVTSLDHPSPKHLPATTAMEPPPREDSPPLSSTQLTSDDESETEYHQEEALLVKSGKLGMSIVGGGNISSAPFGRGRPGIYISKIVPGGSADRTRTLRVGDRILEVNNQNLRRAVHITAVECFTKSGNEITITVQHVPPPPGIQEVSLQKKEGESYGLVIRDDNGPTSVSTVDTETEHLDTARGIFISKIQERSPAAMPGKLRPGQRILEVNGRSLIGLQYKEAVGILSKCITIMVLIVCEGEDSAGDSDEDMELPKNVGAGEAAIGDPEERVAWREMMAKKMTNQTRHMEDLIQRLQDLEENLKMDPPSVPLTSDDDCFDPTN